MASFHCEGNHLFFGRYKNKEYEFVYDGESVCENPKNPARCKLEKQHMEIGDEISLYYDFGASWEFSIKLVDITEMGRGKGTHYPFVNDGAGRGIIEGGSMGMLEEILENGGLHTFDSEGDIITFDYRKYDADFDKYCLKGEIELLEYIYE